MDPFPLQFTDDSKGYAADSDSDDDIPDELKQDFVDEQTGEAPVRKYVGNKWCHFIIFILVCVCVCVCVCVRHMCKCKNETIPTCFLLPLELFQEDDIALNHLGRRHQL